MYKIEFFYPYNYAYENKKDKTKIQMRKQKLGQAIFILCICPPQEIVKRVLESW